VLQLEPTTFDWYCEQGHVGLERVAKARRDPAIVEPVIAALEKLSAIYARLGGDESVLHAARANLFLPVEHFHAPSRTVVCIDGPEHYTSFRLTALSLYSDDEEQMELCRRHAPSSDRVDRGLAAKGFGFGGRQRERAYHDALLDLGAPAMGLAPVIRLPDGDDVQGRLRRLLGS
jgi:hypothetical protein